MVNLIFGLNGVGKTNLLDAIYCLAMTQSYFKAPGSLLYHEGESIFRLEGIIKNKKKDQIVVKSQHRKKKVVEKNGVAYDRLSEHVGYLPVVMIAPDDIELINGGNSLRRTMVDRTLSQIDKKYLECSITYQKLLKQRNSLLKKFLDGVIYDELLLRTYDEKMWPHAKYIYAQRRSFINNFLISFKSNYAILSREQESVDLQYISSSDPDQYLNEMLNNRQRDRILARTLHGPHADKFLYLLNGKEMKSFASQGQKKSAIFSIKLAQYQYLTQHTGIKPLLLLDDIFDRLDHERVNRLVDMILQREFGQVFITDTEEIRIGEYFSTVQDDLQKIEIK